MEKFAVKIPNGMEEDFKKVILKVKKPAEQKEAA
jgi:hypothetical protein